MFRGILFVIGACLCWGLVFVIPKLLDDFSPIEIALGRYLCFGVISLGVLLVKNRSLFHKSHAHAWLKSLIFAFASTLLSYTAIIFCIRYADSAITALIFGMSPITIALYGNWVKREFPSRLFRWPVALMAIGIILANLDAFHLNNHSMGLYLFGLISGFVGLAAWTWYTIANFHYLQENRTINTNEWILMLGVATLALTVVGIILLALFQPDISKFLVLNSSLKGYIAGSLTLGVISSWLGFFLWSCGNLRLPISFAGQLTVFEMIFGLSFVYYIDKRWPQPWEIAGTLVMLLGVGLGFRLLKRLAPNAQAHTPIEPVKAQFSVQSEE